MTEKIQWLKLRNISRSEFRATGGYTWERQPRSPGGSLRIPNHTEFRIRLEGTNAISFAQGSVDNGKFIITKGPGVGDYDSANRAVSAARGEYVGVESNNAFLYVEFRVDSRWLLAHSLRELDEFSFNPSLAEEEGLAYARDVVQAAAKKKRALSVLEVEAFAERLFERDATIQEEGKRRADSVTLFSDISDLGL